MEYVKLQLGCLAVIFFIVFSYFREIGVDLKKKNYSLFNAILINAIVYIFFDGLTAYTVNHLDTVSHTANLICHLCFMISIDTMVFLMFLYILSITDGFPRKITKWILICFPYAVNLAILFLTLNSLEFIHGKTTNYSMGFPAYTCYSL